MVKKNVAQSVYYDSRFILRSNAVSLKEELLNSIKDLDMGKFLHLGMDRPSTNWNVLALINDHQVVNGFQKTLVLVPCIFFMVPFKPESWNGDGKKARYLRHFTRYSMSHLLAVMYIYMKGHRSIPNEVLLHKMDWRPTSCRSSIRKVVICGVDC